MLHLLLLLMLLLLLLVLLLVLVLLLEQTAVEVGEHWILRMTIGHSDDGQTMRPNDGDCLQGRGEGIEGERRCGGGGSEARLAGLWLTSRHVCGS